MLKRLSFNSSDPALPLPSPNGPPGFNSSYPFPPAQAQASPSFYPASPSNPNGPPPSAPLTIERDTLHKSLESFSELLVALDTYRGLLTQVAKAERALGESCKNLSGLFGNKAEQGGRNEVIYKALGSNGAFFDSLAEVDSKYSKVIQKEFQALNETSSKFFKKIAKEERAFDENLGSLDTKVQKATSAYEKSRPTTRSRTSFSDAQSIAQSHDRYITSLSSLSSNISTVKRSHGESMAVKREDMGKEFGKILCEMGEAAWKNKVEGTKKGGERIGPVVSYGVFCESGLPRDMPEEEVGLERKSSLLKGPRPLPQAQKQPSYSSSQFPRPVNYSNNQVSPRFESSSLQAPESVHSRSNSPSRDRTRGAPSSPRYIDDREPREVRKSSLEQPNSRQYHLPEASQQSSSSSQRTYAVPAPKSSNPDKQDVSYSDSTPRYSIPSTSEDSQFVPSDLIAPRGFILDDEPSSPQSLRRPLPVRYESGSGGLGLVDRAPEVDASPQLKRKESTASERNFVARMREKYAADKQVEAERQKVDENQGTDSRDDQPKSPLPRSNSRVAHLAARYSISSPSAFDPPKSTYATQSPQILTSDPRALLSSRPKSPIADGNRSYSRQSLPPPPILNSANSAPTSSGKIRFSDPIPSNSWGGNYSRPSSQQTQYRSPEIERRENFPSESTWKGEVTAQPHSSVCGCESCSSKNYKESKGNSNSQKEEEEIQKVLVQSLGRPGNSRRLSMPVIFGGNGR